MPQHCETQVNSHLDTSVDNIVIHRDTSVRQTCAAPKLAMIVPHVCSDAVAEESLTYWYSREIRPAAIENFARLNNLVELDLAHGALESNPH